MVFSYSEMITESCKQLRNNRQKSIGAVKKNLRFRFFLEVGKFFWRLVNFSGGWGFFYGSQPKENNFSLGSDLKKHTGVDDGVPPPGLIAFEKFFTRKGQRVPHMQFTLMRNA